MYQTINCKKVDVSLKSGHGEQRDYNKLNYNQFEVSNHETEKGSCINSAISLCLTCPFS